MKKTFIVLAAIAILGVCMPSYGAINSGHYVLVYNVSMKASKTLFDVNDTNSLLSGSVAGFLALDINEPNREVIDSNAVFYIAKEKKYKVIPNSATINPHDPCRAELLSFATADHEGEFYIDVVGKGKAIKIYEPNNADANTLVKEFVPATMKGSSTFYRFDIVVPDSTESGTGAASLALDSKNTSKFNSDGNDVDEAINAIVTDLTKKDPSGWTREPFILVTPE
jgi:hypothetical protein